VAVIHSIVTLYERGWSKRRIARELGIDRETVRRHLALAQAGDSKPAISTAGNRAWGHISLFINVALACSRNRLSFFSRFACRANRCTHCPAPSRDTKRPPPEFWSDEPCPHLAHPRQQSKPKMMISEM
jgi:hypothetical protein